MNNKIKEAFSLVLAPIMLFIVASCSLPTGNKESILQLTQTFGEAICARDMNALSDISLDFDDNKVQELNDYLDYDTNFTPEKANILNLLADSLTFTIDEDSIDASRKMKSGTVTIHFQTLDYESTYEGESYSSPEEFIQLLESSSRIDYSIDLDFKFEDSRWLIENTEDSVRKAFEFSEYRFKFTQDLIDYVHDAIIFLSDGTDDNRVDYMFNDSEYIECFLLFENDAPDLDLTNLYCEVSSYDEVLLTIRSENHITLYPEDIGLSSFEDGLLNFTFYDDGEIIGVATVNIIPYEATVPDDLSFEWVMADYCDSSSSYAIYNETDMISLYCEELARTHCYYEVYRDDILLYTSSYGEFGGGYSWNQEAEMDENELLIPGVYEIVFYVEYDNTVECVGSGIADVNMGTPIPEEEEEIEEDNSSSEETEDDSNNYFFGNGYGFGDSDEDDIFFDDIIFFMDPTFENSLSDAYYTSSGSDYTIHGHYFTGSRHVGLGCWLNEEETTDEELYYKWYYISSENFSFDFQLDSLDSMDIEYESSCVPEYTNENYFYLDPEVEEHEIELDDGEWYHFTYDSTSQLKDGCYIIVVSREEEMTEDNLILYGVCFVGNYLVF